MVPQTRPLYHVQTAFALAFKARLITIPPSFDLCQNYTAKPLEVRQTAERRVGLAYNLGNAPVVNSSDSARPMMHGVGSTSAVGWLRARTNGRVLETERVNGLLYASESSQVASLLDESRQAS